MGRRTGRRVTKRRIRQKERTKSASLRLRALPFARSLAKIRKHRRGLGKHRSIWIGGRIGTNDLSRMWSGQPELARHLIDASGIPQLCLSEAKLAVLFLELLHLLLLGFD